MGKYIVAVLMSIGLIVLLIILLVGGSHSSPKSKINYLPNYSSNPYSTVIFTETGPITSNQNHNYFTISVNSSEVRFNLYRGYRNNIVSSKVYNNNDTSYSAFLYALYYAGFTEGNNNPKLRNSTGLCATGNVYTFELLNGGNIVQKYWSTSCGISSTFSGLLINNINLFINQVPDYSKLTEGVNL